MRPHTEGRARGGAPKARRLQGSRISGWTGAACALFLAGILTASTAGWAAVHPRTEITLTQVPDTATVGDRRCLTRREEDCLEEPVPADEPHEAICATCHDLWDRRPAKETAISCSGAECHENPESLSDFHETVHAGTLENCIGCHDPHDAVIPEGSRDCAWCHDGGGARVEWAGGEHLRVISRELAFTHTNHPELNCQECHDTGARHGDVFVARVEDCRSCHHEDPVEADCQSCHAPAELRGRLFPVTRQLDIQVGTLDRPVRELPFDHGRHPDVACQECHTAAGGLRLQPSAEGDCSTCHAEHHTPESSCYSCHEPTKEGAHDVQTHLGCQDSGCHTDVPTGIASVPRTRSMCLACHTELVEHEPQENCADCHRLPKPRVPPGR